MIDNRSMPASVVIPLLAYRNVDEAVEWLCRSFGFRLRLRIGNHRAQLNVPGGGAVVITQGNPTAQAVMVRVEDVNLHHQVAASHGAQIDQAPKDFPYGERQYSVTDFDGNRWHFSQSIADVDPSEWGGETGNL